MGNSFKPLFASLPKLSPFERQSRMAFVSQSIGIFMLLLFLCLVILDSAFNF